MPIDAHAHACGELGTVEGIKGYLNKNGLSKIILCPGEQNSKHNYPVPMIADLLPSPKVGYGFNRMIQRVVKLSGVAKTLDEQNVYVGTLAQEHPNQILQAYWLNPLSLKEIEKMDAYYHRQPFCMVKLHQGWHSFDIGNNEAFNAAISWAESHNCGAMAKRPCRKGH